MSKKITRANFKKFVRENRENLHINCLSSFNGMTDGVDYVKNSQFKPIVSTLVNENYTLGINGVWLVGQSRDMFSHYKKDGFEGIEVYNSCGSFIVAVPVSK